ncbi:citryl-CoA lyase [Mesorhizobium sp. L-8-10]|uniref:citryl-CoA lyase n=1 Tax=unclassified Mesorhizobium TaxID=325217 RepID=UPI0019253FC6|nr:MULTISPECIES: citryl-CoA lyase [unclassified Mesorhizobium]BCH20776.1 citryl-CoA lyase [Mesorhizobium sp. L-8-3]BCH28620.1 citryl-CoA lyase [Mesorhizobium sp. L-8-10]
MRIGKQEQAFTAIATSDADTITIRGHDLCSELIGQIDFTAYFWLLVTGNKPTETQIAVTNACLVAIAEHGLVPSVQAARMTLAAAPEAWQGAMSAGLLGMGTVVAGSSEVAGRYIAGILNASRAPGADLDSAVRASLADLKARREKVPGLGHPQHSAGDPRANVLLSFADDRGVSGDAVACLRALGRIAPELMNRPLPINVSGAIPALMLDAGWPVEAMKGIPLLARAAGLVAHLHEEAQRSIGFIMSHQADLAISYDGPGAATSTKQR